MNRATLFVVEKQLIVVYYLIKQNSIKVKWTGDTLYEWLYCYVILRYSGITNI